MRGFGLVIHVVKQGESLYSIAKLYNVSAAKISADNELSNPEQLVVGQTLVVFPENRRHRVAQGQTIHSIARIYGLSMNEVLAANPEISNPTKLTIGQVINIPRGPGKLGTIEVNGYAFPNIDMEVLRKTLPHLSYLSIFSYEVNKDGSLRTINDLPLIAAARAAKVAPLMVITNLEEGAGFSSDVAAAILRNPTVQNKLLDNVVQNLRNKNYYGLDIDFEYIYPQDRDNYNNFLRKATARLRPLGYTIATALAPKTSANQKGLLYEAHDYPVHGALTDHVILMTYEWGYTFGEPMAVAPINEVRKVLNYAITAIPRKKILMGVPNYGYDWTLPYVEGTAAKTLSNTGAVDLARTEGAAIRFDETAKAPFFNYYDDQRKQHVVWFEDARSMEAKFKLADQYNLGGISYWTIGKYFPQAWLVQDALFNVKKVI